MAGLTLFLAQRTALEAGDPVGVDPAHDELDFLLHPPAAPGAEKPPQDAINRIDAYMNRAAQQYARRSKMRRTRAYCYDAFPREEARGARL